MKTEKSITICDTPYFLFPFVVSLLNQYKEIRQSVDRINSCRHNHFGIDMSNLNSFFLLNNQNIVKYWQMPSNSFISVFPFLLVKMWELDC